MVAIVAAVGVDVVPITEKFAARLASKLLPQASAMGQQLGNTMGKSVAGGVANGVASGVSQGTSKANTGTQGAKAGAEYGGAFASALRKRLEAGLKSLPQAQITAASSGAERELASIRAQMQGLRDAKIGIDIDADAALARVYEVQARLEALRNSEPSVEIDIDAGAALGEILLLRRELAKLDGRNVRVDIDARGPYAFTAGLKSASNSLGLFSAEAATSNLSIVGLGSAGAALAPLIVPAATTAAAAVATIAVAGVTAGAALGVAALAFSGISDAVSALDGAAKQGTKSTTDLFDKQLAIKDATDGLARAERGVASARVENSRSVEAAQRAAADADAEIVSTRLENGRKLEAAQRSADDAQRKSAEVQAENARKLADVQRDAADAAKAVIATAVENARKLADVQRDAADAAKAVTATQVENARKLADVQRDAADAEERVTETRIENARKLEAAQRSAADAEERVNETRIESARKLEAASRSAADAEERVTETRIENARKLEAAHRSQADAEQNVIDIQLDNAQRLESARQTVTDAEERLTDVQVSNAERLEDAERAVIDAQADVVTARERVADAEEGVAQARERVEEADDRLLQSQQRVIDSQDDVVRAVESVADAEDDLIRVQENAARAQEDLTDARKDAARMLEDYDAKVKSGAIDEQQARLRVTQALLKYRQELVNRRASGEDREQALLAYREAIQNYENLQSANKRLAEDKEEADRKGVEGSDQVVAAQRRIVDSTDAIETAQQRLVDSRAKVIEAQRDVTEAQRSVVAGQKDAATARLGVVKAEDAVRDAQAQVVKAQQDVVEATRNVGAVQAENAQNLARAQRTVAEAVKNVADVQADGAARLTRAQRDVADAVANVADVQADGAKALADAQRDAADAVANVARVQADGAKALADAQRDAADAVKNVGLVQQDNAAAYAKAQRDAADASARVGQVEAANAEALTQARRDAADASARVGQVEAANAEALAQVKRAAADAARNVGLVEAENARKSHEAQRAVAEAIKSVGVVQRENAQTLARAQRDAADAARNVGDVQRAASERMTAATEAVTSAQRSLARALHTTGTTGQTAMDKVRESMANLSPAGRAFAKFVQDTIKPAFYALRNTAQEALLPLVTQAFNTLKPLFPILDSLVKKSGKALGEFLLKASQTFTSPFWKDFFTFLGDVIGPNMEWLGSLGLSVAKMFAILFRAFEPVGRTMGKQLAALAERAAEFLLAWTKSDEFKKFVAYAIENAPLMGQLFLSLLKVALQLAIAFAPMGPLLAKVVTQFLNMIAALGPKTLLYIFAVMAASLAALALALGNIGLFIPLAIFAFMSLVAWYKRLYDENRTFRRIIDTTIKVVGAIYTWLWKMVIKPVAIGIGALIVGLYIGIKAAFNAIVWVVQKILAPVFGWLWKNIIKPAIGGITLIIQVAWTILKVIFGLIAAAVLLVGKGFMWLYTKFVKPYLRETWRELQVVWNKYLKPVLTAFGNWWAIHIVPKWRAGIDAIRKAWDTIRTWAKKPVEFFVVTVLNKGLIAGYNKLVEPISKSLKIDPIKWPPAGWSRGGVLPGYRPGIDTEPAMLSQGEGILRPEVVRALGAPQIYAWNAAAMSGHPIQTFARGGLVGSGPGTFPFMQNWLKQKFPRARAMTYQPSFGYHRGNPSASYAADIFAPNMAEVALAIKKAFKPRIKELIHTPLEGAQVWNGKDYTFSGAALRSAHYNHVHWSMLSDGQGSGPGFFDFLGKLGQSLKSPFDGGMKRLASLMHGDTPIVKLISKLGQKAISGMLSKGKDIAKKFLDFFAEDPATSMTGARSGSAKTAQEYARSQMGKFNWKSPQFQSLLALWNGESGWNYKAKNPSSGAYGIPQSLPANKMRSAGADYLTNYKTQINWGMKYIADRYGTPATAYNQWMARSPHWYENGGYLPQGLSMSMNGTGQRERVLNPQETRAYERGRDGSMTLKVIVNDGAVSGLVRVEVDEALGSLADAHVYGGVG